MSSTIRDIAFCDLQRELEMTRKALERIPGDRLSWRPHERSFTVGGLGTHLANLPTWLAATIESDEFDFAKAPPSMTELESTEAIVALFDKNAAAASAALAGIDDSGLAETWTLRHGAHVISADPRSYVVRLWGINHLVHHRAQLSVYLRLLDVPVPAIYGPSADES